MKIILLLLLLASPCFAYDTMERYYEQQEKTETLRYNWSTGKSEYAKDSDQLKYNWSTGKSSYESPRSTLKYNWSTGKHEYAE